MMYEVEFDEDCLKFLEKLDFAVRKRIFDKIIGSKENPHSRFVRLEGRKDYKLRIGDYRAIADIDDAQKKILVTHIGHRKNVYKKP